MGLTGVLKVQQLNQGLLDCCETGKVIMSHCISTTISFSSCVNTLLMGYVPCLSIFSNN
jgi:hypothetical protein